MPTVLFIIAPNDFRDEEYFIPKEILEANGIGVITANLNGTPSRSMFGKIVHVDKDIYSVNPSDFDGIVFVGGPGASIYFNNKKAHELARTFYSEGKVVAAICIAPSILANAGILRNRRATAWPSERNNINTFGTYTGAAVEEDDNIITANGPAAAKVFGEAILNKILEKS